MECLEHRVLFHDGVALHVAFALPSAQIGEPYDTDAGAVYSAQDDGVLYGWEKDNSANVHERHVSAPDQLHKGYAILPAADQNVWQIQVPDDDYTVHVVAGDAGSTSGHYRINVEGVLTVDGSATKSDPWVEGTQIVSVSDGKLTVSSAKGAGTNKIDYIDIVPFDNPVTISVAADPATQTRGAHGGGFIFSRDGSVSEATTYQYFIGGSAVNGQDDDALSGTITFPVGAASVNVPITPDYKNLEGTKTVMVTLVPEDDFLIGNLSATTTIVGNNRGGSSASPLAASSTSFSKTSINFQPSNAAVPDFFKADTGAVFGMRANGLQYGWNVDNSGNTRDRNSKASPDQSYDTLTQMQAGGTFSWQMSVPNGTYTVRVVAGDASYTDSIYKINVEGVLTVSGTPTSANHWVEGTKTVTVSDGKLTISNATGSKNNKIDFIVITPGGSSSALPVVSAAASGQPSESGATVTFTFTRTGSTASSLAVTYTLGGTATNGTDYVALSGAVTIPAGSASASITLKPIDDSIAEGSESVVLTVSPSSSYTTNTTATVSRSIADNDITVTPSGTLKWTTAAAAPIVRAEAMGAEVNGKVYEFGGYINSTYHPVATVSVYDIASNKWSQLKDMPFGAITHSGTAVDGNFIYFAGGYPGHGTAPQTFFTTNVWRYNTTNDTWAAMPALPAGRGAGTMVNLNHTLYFFGGADTNRADRSEMWSLDLSNPSAGWVQRASMPGARNHVGGVALDGFIYVIGGQTGQDNASVFKSDVWRYDPDTNKWVTEASLPNQPRSHIAAATFVYNGQIIAEGGEGPGRVALRNVEEYDPTKNKWVSLTPLPAGRSSGIGVNLGDGRIMYSSGYSGQFNNQTWIGSFG